MPAQSAGRSGQKRAMQKLDALAFLSLLIVVGFLIDFVIDDDDDSNNLRIYLLLLHTKLSYIGRWIEMICVIIN